MTMQWILGWWNLIFVAPFALALLYLGVYTLTGLDSGDADADVDADAHLYADVDADADADGHDTETDFAAPGSLHALALSWLGVGRVPVSLILIVFLLTWGAAGFVANALLRPAEGWDVVRLSLPIALLGALFITRCIVLFMGRFVPLNESYALHRKELIGATGQALYAINETFGLASVRDNHGDLHQVSCKVAAGISPVEKGAKVKLVAYGGKDRTFYVRKVETM